MTVEPPAMYELISEAKERPSPEFRCGNCVAFDRYSKKNGNRVKPKKTGRCLIWGHSRSEDQYCGWFYSRKWPSPVLTWTPGEDSK